MLCKGVVMNSILPEGWKRAKLTDLLVLLETGTRPKGGAIGITEGVPSISAEQMTNRGVFDFSAISYVPSDFYSSMNRGHIKADDILIVKDGATTGKTCFVDESFPFKKAVINEHVFICRADRKTVLPLYLFYWLWGPLGQYQIKSTFQGAAIGGINQKFADSVIVLIPPLSEQERIVKILNDQFSAVEKARQASEKQLETVQLLPVSFSRSVFNEISSENTVPLKSLVSRSITYGIVQSGDDMPGGVRTIRGGDIKDFRVDINQLKRVDPIVSAQYGRTILRGDELLLVIRGYPGNVCIVDEKLIGCNIAREIALIAPNNSVSRTYLQYVIASRNVQETIAVKTKGAAQRGINLSDVSELLVPLPPLPKQKRIAKIIERKLQSTEQLRQSLETQLSGLNAIPASLLRKAFQGEL